MNEKLIEVRVTIDHSFAENNGNNVLVLSKSDTAWIDMTNSKWMAG